METTDAPAASGPGPTGCAVDEVFQLLSRAYMLDLLYLFNRPGAGTFRFKDLQAELDISPNTLTERLKELTQAGLVTRTAYNEIPPRVDYEATDKALDLCDVFVAISTWADRHDLASANDGAPAQTEAKATPGAASGP